mmetsp:Transcript_43623/g.105220  ORF Transcript_43623/g.105220 Transcript_43623/m.105220 type:complete len:436 (+) Transcript_43623:204-1511(+)
MLEQHARMKEESLMLSDDSLSGSGNSSSAVTPGVSSIKENLTSDHVNHTKDDNDDDDMTDNDNSDGAGHSDDDVIDNSKRKSVLQMANAIEAAMSPVPNQAVRKPAVTLGDDADNVSVSTPPSEKRQSQFWSLQGDKRSSIASGLSKINKRPQQPPIYNKTPLQEPKETLNIASSSPSDLNGLLHVSPVTSPAAICTTRTSPKPKSSSPTPTKSTSNRTVTTRENLEGTGPKVRLTRAEVLRLKAKEQQQQQQKQQSKREEKALKPRFFNNNRQPSRTPRQQKDYPKPWLVSSDSKNKTPPKTRTSRTGTSRLQEPPLSTGKEPQINQLPGRRRRSRSKPATMTTTAQQPGNKVRLTRSAILKLRQSQEKAANQMTLQDMDNQRLGIPPVKYLEIPTSPTKINFDDDEMEHPNDIARRKLRQLFDDNSSSKQKAR